MRRKFLFLRAILGFAFFAALLSGPATAWNSHLAQHSTSSVAIDAHHHHDEDGGAAQDTNDELDSSGQERGGDTGHTHLPSGSATMSAVVPDAIATAMHYAAEPLPAGRTSLVSPGRATPPQKRPPRSV